MQNCKEMAYVNIAGNNPWNGLRAYSEGEMIYGRDDEIRVLSQLVLQNHYVVLYGLSGIGKSSIVNAGVSPIVRTHGLVPVYVRLEHNSSVSYFEQVRDAVDETMRKSGVLSAERIEPSPDESLWEFFHRVDYTDSQGAVVKPMVVFDQFEEIFTLERDKTKVMRFFRQIGALVNNVMPEQLAENVSMHRDDELQNESENAEEVNLGLTSLTDVSYFYKSEADSHFVFIIREDFLSYFERNTMDTPALRNNRYCLQPINGLQAVDIITKPRHGLVGGDVARLIIAKITDEKDMANCDLMQLNVDSSILSLYLSRLYEKMCVLGQTVISAKLVEEYSDDIKDEFYTDAVTGLTAETVQWLENTLINPDGRRDNRSRRTVLDESGLSELELDRLIFDVKLLRQFSYGGDLRIEFVHDVLCQVIVGRKQKREEEARMAELKVHSQKEKRRFAIRSSVIALIVIVATMIVSVWFVKNNTDVKIIDQQQNLVLSLEEDRTVKTMDFWRADLTVVGVYPSGRDSVLLSQKISKAEVSNTYTINTDSCRAVSFMLDFGDFVDIGRYENQKVDLLVSEIMESPAVKLYVKRDVPDMIQFRGSISLDVIDLDLPVEDAVVLIGDAMALTDSIGGFNLLLEKLPDENESLMIAKSGLGCFEIPATSVEADDSDMRRYRVLPVDSLKSFYDRFEDVDTVDRWNYSTVGQVYCANQGSQNGLYVKFDDGREDRLKMYLKKLETNDDKVMLKGCFYFKDEKENLDILGLGKFAYYFATGYIDRNARKDENNIPYRNFEVRGVDAASNLMTIRGKYYVVRGAGKYTGEITSHKHRVATFGIVFD